MDCSCDRGDGGVPADLVPAGSSGSVGRSQCGPDERTRCRFAAGLPVGDWRHPVRHIRWLRRHVANLRYRHGLLLYCGGLDIARAEIWNHESGKPSLHLLRAGPVGLRCGPRNRCRTETGQDAGGCRRRNRGHQEGQGVPHGIGDRHGLWPAFVHARRRVRQHRGNWRDCKESHRERSVRSRRH